MSRIRWYWSWFFQLHTYYKANILNIRIAASIFRIHVTKNLTYKIITGSNNLSAILPLLLDYQWEIRFFVGFQDKQLINFFFVNNINPTSWTIMQSKNSKWRTYKYKLFYLTWKKSLCSFVIWKRLCQVLYHFYNSIILLMSLTDWTDKHITLFVFASFHILLKINAIKIDFLLLLISEGFLSLLSAN